jgi:hypothetical protein
MKALHFLLAAALVSPTLSAQERELAAIEAALTDITGLKFHREVPYAVIDKAQLHRFLEERMRDAVYGAVVARAAGAVLSPLVSLFLYCYALYALIYATPRYASQLFPILFILAAMGVVTLWRKRPRRAHD